MSATVSNEQSRSALLLSFAHEVFRRAPGLTILLCCCQLAVVLSEGIGLLLIIPLLAVLGLASGSEAPNSLVTTIESLFTSVGLDVSLNVLLVVFVALIAAQALAVFYQNYFRGKLSYVIVTELREELFHRVLHCDWLTFCTLRSSDLLHTITTELERIGYLILRVVSLAISVLMTLVYLGIACKLSLPITLAVSVCGLALMLLVNPIMRRSCKLGEQYDGEERRLYSIISEQIAALKQVKHYSKESTSQLLFQKHLRNLMDFGLQADRNGAAVYSIFVVGAAVLMALMVYCAVEILHTPTTSMVLLAILFSRLLPKLSGLQEQLQGLLDLLPAIQQVKTLRESLPFTAKQSDSSSSSQNLKNQISLENVSFSYSADKSSAVLSDANLTLTAGTFNALVGPSGVGKTTLADIIIGLLHPDAGRIVIDGVELNNHNLQNWKNCVSYVSQDTFLFNTSIRENLLWAAPEASEEQLLQVLSTLNLGTLIAKSPQGLDTVVGERGIKLSGGERQRLSLARAMLRQPQLLILDEATSAIDLASERRVLDALNSLRGKTTILFISHRPSAVAEADTVHVIRDGRITESSQASHANAVST